jgi:hypothetical protein
MSEFVLFFNFNICKFPKYFIADIWISAVRSSSGLNMGEELFEHQPPQTEIYCTIGSGVISIN